MVDIETGQTLAFLRFEDLVQEIFAVELLPADRLPRGRRARLRPVNLTYVVPDEALEETA